MQKSGSAHTPLWLMHLGFLFCGAGTLMLGATLPVFAQRWHLNDSQSGLLLAAQFCGLSLGSIAISRNLRRTLLMGCATAMAGFSVLLAACQHAWGYPAGVASLLLLGLGLGQVTVTINLLAAVRYSEPGHRSSALSLLNFTWSAGAVISPLLAGLYLTHASLALLLVTFIVASAALLAAVFLLLEAVPHQAAAESASALPGIGLPVILYFALVFLLYGGLEATLGGWLSTYTIRYTTLGLAAAAYCTTTMLAAFAGGRALAAIVLRHVPEQRVRIAGIALTGSAALGLRSAHTGPQVVLCAILIGLGIAAFFPVTFSLLISRKPTPRQAGICTSNIGLGSALFPYLTGFVSNHTGSLRSAMLAPVAIAAALLLLCHGTWLARLTRHADSESSPLA